MSGSTLVETLHCYLRRHVEASVIDFTIRAKSEPGSGVKFYIRPTHISGDTRDFLLWADPETGWDMVFPENAVQRPDHKAFADRLRAKTVSPNASPSATEGRL